MSKHKKFRERLFASGSENNINFEDLMGYLDTIPGLVKKNAKHQKGIIFACPEKGFILNLQPDKNGKAKSVSGATGQKLFEATVMKDNYSMIARWSETDGRYIAFVPELPGCVADGETLEEVTRALVLAMKDWLETAKELEMEIPPAVSHEEDAKQPSHKQQQELKKKIQGLHEELVESIREKLLESDERLLSTWKLVKSKSKSSWLVIGAQGRRLPRRQQTA